MTSRRYRNRDLNHSEHYAPHRRHPDAGFRGGLAPRFHPKEATVLNRVFVVKEDASRFSYADRYALVAADVKGIHSLTLYELVPETTLQVLESKLPAVVSSTH